MSNGNLERERVIQDIENLTQVQSDLADDLKFTPEDINAAYMNQPAKFAYWAIIAAQSKSALDKKKLEVERQEDFLKKTLVGELDRVVRQNLETEGERVTEAKVSSNIFVHARYLEEQSKLYQLQEEMLELQQQYGLLYAAKEAMIHRKDMLVSLGAQLRQENEQ